MDVGAFTPAAPVSLASTLTYDDVFNVSPESQEYVSEGTDVPLYDHDEPVALLSKQPAQFEPEFAPRHFPAAVDVDEDDTIAPFWQKHQQQHQPHQQPIQPRHQQHQQHPLPIQQQLPIQPKFPSANGNRNNNSTALEKKRMPEEVIELLDDDDDDDEVVTSAATSNKGQTAAQNNEVGTMAQQRVHKKIKTPTPAAITSYERRQIPEWMTAQQQQAQAQPMADRIAERPHYLLFPPNFTPTWNQLVPPRPTVSAESTLSHITAKTDGDKQESPESFELSLLNVNEFTLQGVFRNGLTTTDISGLHKPIRQMCRQHNCKGYRDPATRKWHIPLAAYQDVYIYLSSHKFRVMGIPPTQLQIAALERERQEKGYPNIETIISYGVPKLLAETLAPFQRGGVDFVREKEGRALIADEMGLGKSIQSVASMAMYMDEWPLMVITPSGARYHWEHEFKHWLRGTLQEKDIFVMTSGLDLIPRKAKVVIYSYGLIKAIPLGYFQCAICDESHMLKNLNSKRTRTLAPILKATKRCLLLSGTPALANPLELWPQLDILGISMFGWNIDYDSFEKKFSKRGNRAELHTMLVGTVMIRRLKNDILKSMPKKIRLLGKVFCVKSREQQALFVKLMERLRQSKGVLGGLAKAHRQQTKGNNEFGQDNHVEPPVQDTRNSREQQQRQQQHIALKERQFEQGCIQIREAIRHQAGYMHPDDFDMMERQMQDSLRERLGFYQTLTQAKHHQEESLDDPEETEEVSKRHTLTKLYSLTAEVKIPLVVEMLKRWLADDTKGKVCIFAHHLSVLDALEANCDLSASIRQAPKFIRIDGSTTPRLRQDQITAFQTDPSIRVALLGITAAGVAVTLTAASTVWFAELFWTPAIMIQAEDRCHRIGQAAQVKCLYLVARGTLDDVLWRLIEKKFRDLGEFVEGKEQLKLVVETEYENNADLMSSIFDSSEDAGNDEGQDYDDGNNYMADFNLTFDDIAELGEEERKMLSVDGDEVVLAPETECEGQTEHSAILLLDDDDMEKKPAAHVGKKEMTFDGDRDDETERKGILSSKTLRSGAVTTGQESPDAIPEDSILWGCRLFKVIFTTSTLGLSVKLFHGRVVIFNIKPERRLALGEDCKPGIGDILVSVGGYPLPRHYDLTYLLNFMKYFLKAPPVEMQFIEAPRVAFEFLNTNWRVAEAPARTYVSSVAPKNQVIELLDD